MFEPFLAFLTEENQSINPISYSYDYMLVVMSVIIAALASYTAFQLIERVIATATRQAKTAWIIAEGGWKANLIEPFGHPR